MSEPAAAVRAEDQPSWAEVVRRAEHGESLSVIAHGSHVADVVPSGELDRLRATIAVLSGRGMSAGAEALTAARPGGREAGSLARDVRAAGEPVRRTAEEQAALRRVATLVAQGAAPEEVFAAVAAEVGRVLDTDFTFMSRYDPDGGATVLAAWARTGAAPFIRAGDRIELRGRNVNALVFQTRRPARIDDYANAWGPTAEAVLAAGVRSAVGVPVIVEGRPWGVMLVASTKEPLPAGTEARLAGFTELVATAIANAESRAALTASRARIVATADATRCRIERDLHDGAQQRLVSLALQVRATQAAAPPGAAELARRLDGVAAGLEAVLEELREIARGIHPAVLSKGGLRPALKTLARRCTIPVDLRVDVKNRLPGQIEIAAYYAVGEALTNIAKHAHASGADVEVAARDGLLHVRVRDDGCGGAGLTGGSGLVGLKDRAEALGGRIWLHSPPGAGTAVQIILPVGDPSGPGPQAGPAGPPDESGRGPAVHPGAPGPAPRS